MTDSETTVSAVQVNRVVKASRQRVFDAWIVPELRQQWWAAHPGMSCPFAEIDAKVGGKYRIGMRAPDADQDYITVGEFVEINPPSKLVFTWTWEQPAHGGANTLVTVQFLEVEGGTEVRLTHERFTDQAHADEHNQGWNGCLDSLAATIGKLE